MKKWKIGILLTVNSVLVYAVFLSCLHEPKSISQQVNSKYGLEEEILRRQQSRLMSISLSQVSTPTSVTVEETRKIRKDNGDRFDLLDSGDKAFLIEVAGAK